jgi:hypothetical protein
MRKPTHTALRWGPPIALTAAAIAALFVVPVFGGTTSNLKDRINATQLVMQGATITPTKNRVGSLRLRSGNYVVTSNYGVFRKPSDQMDCRLELRDTNGLQGVQTNSMLGPIKNTAQNDRVKEPGSLNVVAHVGADARAVLRCSGYGEVDPFADITALRVPKVIQKSGLHP